MLLVGCFPETGDNLLVAPKLPGDYLMLQTELAAISESGAIPTAPDRGSIRRTVQLIDMDGDGIEEAVSFFQDAPGANQFSVYLHKRIDAGYTLVGRIQGNGLSIDSVYFPRAERDGTLAMVVCWNMGPDINGAMTIAHLSDDTLTEALAAEYTDIFISDFGEDGKDEILAVVYQHFTSQYAVICYDFNEDHTVRTYPPVALSSGILGVSRIREGMTSNGRLAVFFDVIASGKGYLTDVIVKQDNSLVNITLDSTSGISTKTYRPVSVPSSRLTGERTHAIPLARVLPGYSAQSPDAQWLLEWHTISSYGTLNATLTTYWNSAEEWYFIWPEKWGGDVTAIRTVGDGRGYTCFAQFTGDEVFDPIFYLYAVTAENRSMYEQLPNYVRIGATTNTSYYLRMPDSPSSVGRYRMTEDDIRDAFRIIPKSWSD